MTRWKNGLTEEGDGMNHDRAHCIDFSPDCPESCFRAELTREALEKNWTIVDWSHFEGTEECKKKEVKE